MTPRISEVEGRGGDTDHRPGSWRWEATIFDGMMVVVERALLAGERSRLLSHASGEVLEIAAGTGLNLTHYPATCEPTLTDHKPALLGSAIVRARQHGRSAKFQTADAQHLPFPEAAFDTVVATLALGEACLG